MLVRALGVMVMLGPLAAAANEPLTLDRAIEMARRHHPAIDAQRAQLAIARARAEQALAFLFPYLTGAFAYEPQTPNFVVTPATQRSLVNVGRDTVIDSMGQPVLVSCVTPGQGNCVPSHLPPISYSLESFWSASAGVTWTVWDWGRSIRGYQSARATTEAAEIGMTTVRRNVVLGAEVAFFAVIAAEEQIKVGEESVATYRTQLEQTREFYRNGLRTGIDVATAESGLAGAELVLARARAAVATSRSALSTALGEDRWHDWRLVYEGELFDVRASDEKRLERDPLALVEVAMQKRTELGQIQLSERSFRKLAESNRGEYLPQLQLSAGPTWSGIDIANLVPNVGITAALAFPVGGMSPLSVNGQVREAEGNLAAALAQERALREGIRQETLNARALLAAAREEVASAKTLVQAATAQRDLAIGRYKTGVGNIVELSDALLNYVSARFARIQAGYDLASARASLDHALGEGD
jgi:outer membrane protein TolC